ncbi:MAG: tetratricopeptide repeat protein [Burkholderiaceae bacterium]
MPDISMQNFESELVTASMQQPVLLDIWAPWCGPCKTLGPVLEKLETSYAGRFVLAKLNSDDQPEIAGQLSQMFGVRSIPFCVLFKDGQPVDGFVGALPEAQIRSFLDKHVPSAEEAEAEQEASEAESLLAQGDVEAALEKLQEAVAINPANDAARYDYLRALLGEGRIEDARRAYEPVASNVVPDARFTACGHWLDACEKAASGRSTEALESLLSSDKRDFEARFELAQRHFAAQRFTDAMDALLEILMRDKDWREGLARKTYVAVLEVMSRPAPKSGDGGQPKSALELTGAPSSIATDPVVDSYRRRLSMIVF